MGPPKLRRLGAALLLVLCLLSGVFCGPNNRHQSRRDEHGLRERLSGPLEANIFIISLLKSTDRRAHVQDHMHALGRNYTLVNAMEASLQGKDVLVKQPQAEHGLLIQGGWPQPVCTHEAAGEYKAAGCTFSHLAAVHQAYRSGTGLAMIMEDDMAFLQWPSQRLVFSAPPGWDVLQLYSMGPKIQQHYAQPTALWLPWTYDAWSTGCYLINRQGMQRLLEVYAPASLHEDVIREVQLPPPPPCDPEDFVYRSLKAYTCTDLFAYEAEGSSSLHSDSERMQIHRYARNHVQEIWAGRGSIHH